MQIVTKRVGRPNIVLHFISQHLRVRDRKIPTNFRPGEFASKFQGSTAIQQDRACLKQK